VPRFGHFTPGIINAHDHITYARTPPPARTEEHYEHRHDWRVGKNGHTKIPSSGDSKGATKQIAELRLAMGGATATNGHGGDASPPEGVGGFLRSVDPALAWGSQEGLGAKRVITETFPPVGRWFVGGEDAGGLVRPGVRVCGGSLLDGGGCDFC